MLALRLLLHPVGRWLALTLVVALALGAWHWKTKRDAEARLLAELVTKTQAESERRGAVINAARKNAERQVEAIAAERTITSKLLEEIAHASAANDAVACLDPAAAGRLRNVGANRHPPRRGAGKRRPAR